MLNLAILPGRSAYGYEITAWLREQGLSDIAEGTVYALLVRLEQRRFVDVETVPSEKGRRARCFPQRSGAATPRRVQENPELPR
jgi:PadR family transcriptional regulator, regulatory protein PadR